jgi:flagellum-specific peptidoglycan hydrolase FlgJ
MPTSLDLTQALAMRRFPDAKTMRSQHWSFFEFRRAMWYVNLLWTALLIALGVMLYFSYLVAMGSVQRERSAAQRARELQEEIVRLQALNFYTSRQTIDLAKKIQLVVDTAESGAQREFLKMVVPEAIRLQITHRIPASATVAMAIYESRYGTSQLAQDHNNFFGIKALSRLWDGPKTLTATKDRGVRTQAYFRCYEDYQQGVIGYGQFLSANERYKAAFNHRRGDEFVQAVLRAGYCPDADYYSNIRVIMARHKLPLLDMPDENSTPAEKEAPPITGPQPKATAMLNPR